MTHLADIHPNLYLSDYDWAMGNKDGGQYDNWGHPLMLSRYRELNLQTVIHILDPDDRDRTWNHPEYKVTHVNFKMADDRTLCSYHEFRTVVTAISKALMKHLPRGPLVIHCYAGVNRSVCGVLAYVLRKRIMGLNEAVAYIEEAKKTSMGETRLWDTLTNKTFRAFMGQLETDTRLSLVESTRHPV